jgi:hypothetical protein
MRVRLAFASSAVAVAVLSLLTSPAIAQERAQGVFRLGGDYGGERVLELEYTDGRTPDVTAGGGLLLTAGGMVPVLARGAHTMEAQVNLGLKFRTIPAAENQEVTWLRFPLEGLLYYRLPKGIRLGGGATMHFRNVIDASGEVVNGRVAFKPSPGLLLQAEYVRRNVSFDLRYTAMTYRTNGGSADDVGASSLGVGVSYFVARRPR